MENASKALLLAGGVLIAIMVVSLFMIMMNQVSHYEASKSQMEQDSQLAQFNKQFAQFAQDNSTGMDVISALNQVVDYNLKKTGAREIDYSKKITVKVNVTGFNSKHAAHFLFGSTTNYTVTSNSDPLMQIIKRQIKAEKDYGGINALSALSSNAETIKKYYRDHDTVNGKSIKQVLGKELSTLESQFNSGNFDILDEHTEYSNFKTSKFTGRVTDTWDNEQIKELTFSFNGT